jgi:hypothetical protein
MRNTVLLFSVSICPIVASTLTAADVTDWTKHPINQWVKQSPREGAPVPNFPYEGSGDYDPFTKRWIHHAGHDGIPQGFHTFVVDLDSGKWEQRFPPTSPPGVCCVDGTNAFDIANRRFVRFPGGSLGHGYQWSRGVKLKESAAWLYDTFENKWQNMRPPPYKEPEKNLSVGGLNSGAVYVPNYEITLTFGGQGSGGGKNALFAYDAYSNTLTHLKAENPPPARDGMGLAYDTRNDKLVMFGSQYSQDEKTWLYDLKTNKWEGLDLNPHPPAVKATKEYSTIPRMAYDPANGVVLCIAWLGDKGHETWSFDVGKKAWTKLNATTEPDQSKSRSRNLGFDSAHNVFILETSEAKTNKPQIWTYRLANSKPDSGPSPPTDLSVITEKGGKARLAWKPSASGTTKYEIYRGQGDEPWKVDFKRIGTSESTKFEDTGLEKGRGYTYHVKAIGNDGTPSGPSLRARTQIAIVPQPTIEIATRDIVSVQWTPSSAQDVIGYNVYRGTVHVRTVIKGNGTAWKDNDPEYAEPQVVQVRDIGDIVKLNKQPIANFQFGHQWPDNVDLLKTKSKASGDYKYAVYAYIVRSVNELGVESGPSPYALTIPSEPLNVMCREEGEIADVRWTKDPDLLLDGYHVYKLDGTWKIVRITVKPIKEPRIRHKVGKGQTRFWVTAVDVIGQEGQPSSPAWFNHSFRGFYTGEWHQ